MNEHFKQCPKCKAWFSIDEIMYSLELEPVGMQIEDDCPEANLYYFNHRVDGCGTTFAVSVLWLSLFIGEPVPSAILAGSAVCEGHCGDLSDNTTCQQICSWAPFRKLLHAMQASRQNSSIENNVT